MFLNYDCLRDVLLALERRLEVLETPDFLYGPDFPNLTFSVLYLNDLMSDDEIKGYSRADVFYSLHNLKQAGFITARIQFAGDSVQDCAVTDITYEGHMFLRNISDNTVWSTLKRKFGPALSLSLPLLNDLASRFIAGTFGLPS